MDTGLESLLGGEYAPAVAANAAALCAVLATSAVLSRRAKGTDGAADGAAGGAEAATGDTAKERSVAVRYLVVFLTWKLGDWMQGPYFHEVYLEKARGDVQAVAWYFLTGFLAAMVGGVFAGSVVDARGRRFGSVCGALGFAAAAWSVTAWDANVLLVGRVAGGVATSLLFTAPEAWLVGECARAGLRPGFLGGFFGWVYFLDSVVAIAAGYAANASVAALGRSTAAFEVSGVASCVAALLAVLLWAENPRSAAAASSDKEAAAEEERGGLSIVLGSPSLVLLACMQGLFEGAMYVFVMTWGRALTELTPEGPGAEGVPFGLIFSCFMMACMTGSTLVGCLTDRGYDARTLLMCAGVLSLLGMGASLAVSDPVHMAVAYSVYEAGVGMYFPCMGSLRAQHVPDGVRGAVTTWFRVPMNLIVIASVCYYKDLGVTGCSVAVLCCMVGFVALAASFGSAAAKEAGKAKKE